MADMFIKKLKELDIRNDDLTIHVRVLKSWYTKENSDPKENHSFEIIFVDEEGTTIQATVPKNLIYKFEKTFEDSKSFFIYSPNVFENRSSFCIGPTGKKISFYFKTKPTISDKFCGPQNVFNFSKFENIINAKSPSKVSIDVIGEITFLGPLLPPANSKYEHRMEIHLQDIEGVLITATLWGKFTEILADYLKDKKPSDRVIIIIQFCRLNVYNGTPSVGTYYGGTHLYINSDIPEINEFKEELFSKRPSRESSSSLTVVSAKSYSHHDDFLKLHEFKNISDILEPIQVKRYVVMATVAKIDQSRSWFYLACSNCKRTAKEKVLFHDLKGTSGGIHENVMYYCTNTTCTNLNIRAIPRYKIPLRVQDSTGSVTLSLFDRDAFRFLRKPAVYFVDKIKQMGLNTDLYPEELKMFVDMTFAFKILISDFNVTHNDNCYTILNLTNEEDILNKLAIKMNDNQDDGDFVVLDEDQSPSNILKECNSECGDNVTPSTIEKNDSFVSLGDGTTIENIQKRKLITIYDEDDLEQGSSSKMDVKLKSVEDDVQLKIPKKEII